MIVTRVTVQIDRPPAAVFAFVSDPAHFPRWAGTLVKESRQTSPGAVGVGTTFTQVNRLLGRRFTSEMRPVEQWSDRNGDGRVDLVEVYRDGALIARLVDADYDGTANVLRRYDASGALTREERY